MLVAGAVQAVAQHQGQAVLEGVAQGRPLVQGLMAPSTLAVVVEQGQALVVAQAAQAAQAS